MIKRIEGWRETMRFSPDGTLFFAHDDQQQDIGVFSVSDGELTMRIKPGTNKVTRNNNWPHSISPDNALLVDGDCFVWDVKTGKQRFHVPNIYYNSIAFTNDSRYLAVVAKDKSASWIAWYDTHLGQEDVAKRTSLTQGESPGMHLAPYFGNPKSHKKYLVASGTPGSLPAHQLLKWLAKIPSLQALGQDKMRDEYVLVDAVTAQEVCRGPSLNASVSPDGETLVLSGRDNREELCDIPPRKPIKKYLLLSASFSILLLWPIVVRRLFKRYATNKRSGGLSHISTVKSNAATSPAAFPNPSPAPPPADA